MSFGRLDRRSGEQPMSEINVTPLVDVMLVLLVIFLLSAPFFTRSLKLDLPRAELPASPPAAGPSVQVDLVPDGQVFLNGLAVTPAQLAQRLAEAAAARPDTEVQLRADPSVPYGRVVQVMGAAQTAGLWRIGFVAEPLPAR